MGMTEVVYFKEDSFNRYIAEICSVSGDENCNYVLGGTIDSIANSIVQSAMKNNKFIISTSDNMLAETIVKASYDMGFHSNRCENGDIIIETVGKPCNYCNKHSFMGKNAEILIFKGEKLLQQVLDFNNFEFIDLTLDGDRINWVVEQFDKVMIFTNKGEYLVDSNKHDLKEFLK